MEAADRRAHATFLSFLNVGFPVDRRTTPVITVCLIYKSMIVSAHPSGENTCSVTGGAGSALAVYSIS